jgi:hypothetical protein
VVRPPWLNVVSCYHKPGGSGPSALPGQKLWVGEEKLLLLFQGLGSFVILAGSGRWCPLGQRRRVLSLRVQVL